MINDIQPSQPSNSSGSAGDISPKAKSALLSALKKIQNINLANFFIPNSKTLKNILIVGAIVIIIMGTSSLMMWGLALAFLARSFGEPSGNFGNGSCPQAFDLSAHTIYEEPTPIGDFDANWARTDEARQYAISTLGIPEEAMKNPSKSEVEDMIRAEVVNQFNNLSDKHGSNVVDAQIAALSYQEHESSSFQLFDSDGKPSYTISGQMAVINIMSLSNDKFCTNGRDRDDECASYWKNKRTAASYDIHYAIYLGVKEIMSAFSTKVSGEGQQRWKNAIGYVFLPSNPDCYWNGGRSYCRHTVARDAWNKYESTEVAYVCNTGTYTRSGGVLNGNVIVLDPGHKSNYNKFLRPANGLLSEGDHNWLIANKVKRNLEAKGYTVFLTKDSVSEDPPLSSRAAFANSKNATFFLSIHSNAKGGVGPIGIIYCSGSANRRVDYKPDSCANNSNTRYGRDIVRAIVQNLVNNLGLTNPRYWGGDLGVLSDLNMPGALVEMFAHDQESDLNKIDGKSDILAKSISDGITQVVKPNGK